MDGLQGATRMTEKLTFHLGVDYAVVMRPGQTTENPLANIYGQSKDVERFGKLFAAAPDMLAALRGAMVIIDSAPLPPHSALEKRRAAVLAAISAQKSG